LVLLALIASAALLAVDIPPASSSDGTQQAYQAAKAAAGRSPDDQVRLAYWCEAHGLGAERMRHLAQAVLADPNHFTARGLLGLVSRQGHWMRPEAVAEQVKADPALAATLAEYDAKRSSTPYTADGQWGLALWAEERGLKDQAKAHLTAVVRLDPRREVAWKRLGYKKHDGRWATDAELAAAKADAEAQKLADRKWKPLLEKWKAQLSRPSQKTEAEANLSTVTDPKATTSITRIFMTDRPTDQMMAARLFGQIDSIASSRSLAVLAIFSASSDARRVATETLRNRDAREFADLLISQLSKPIRFEVRPVAGPGSVGYVFIEGKQFNTQRVYVPPAFSFNLRPGDQLGTDIQGLPIVQQINNHRNSTGRIIGSDLLQMMRPNPLNEMGQPALLSNPGLQALFQSPTLGPNGRAELDKLVHFDPASSPLTVANKLRTAIHNVGIAEHKNPSQFGFTLETETQTVTQIPVGQMMLKAQKTAAVAQRQLQNDVQTLDAMNRQIRRNNDQVQQVLTTVTGENYADDAQAWKNWWINQVGYRSSSTPEAPVPTFVQDVPIDYQPLPLPTMSSSNTTLIGFQRMSCFGAGTLVQTMTGPRSIEQLKVGDMLLTQSTASGALTYQPILATHHNPPSPTFRINFGDEVIVSSPLHRFWLARRG